MSTSLLTNIISLFIVLIGYFSPIYSDLIFITGLFAFSGGITNWLAVHMLFEKIPFLYGSGVIPNRFEEFKSGIKQLVIQEFFTREHIDKFFQNKFNNSTERILKKIDFDKVFEGLADAIESSSMGGMLGMLGGRKALYPLKEPVIKKLKEIIDELISNQIKNNNKGEISSLIINQVEKIIDNRLEELTPDQVKKIVQDMIRKHLGWLVIWGAVFGGLIGFIFSLVKVLFNF